MKAESTTQLGMPSVDVTPSNSILVMRKDSWMITRFALERDKKEEKKVAHVNRNKKRGYSNEWLRYKLSALNKELIPNLIQQLSDQMIEYEIQ